MFSLPAYPTSRNEEKNLYLIETRGISFDEIDDLIINKKIHYIGPHPNTDLYPHQILIIVVQFEQKYRDVPAVIDHERQHIFLKTIFPSRRFTHL